MRQVPEIDTDGIDAVIFDLDGVITRTASVHEASWERLFNEYLRERSDRTGERFERFGSADYLEYVDGKPRYDGVHSFLQSRGIEVPWGGPEDSPDAETVCGLGNRKNDYFLDRLRVAAPRGGHGTHLRESQCERCPGSSRPLRAIHRGRGRCAGR
jgi:beta-phosphoglucomutase-like phosphatase (HAD superfamily)